MAILIEHFAGAFPVWLSPEQVRVLPITDDQRAYAEEVTRALHDAGLRVHLDARSETLKYRVAEGARMKVPYLLVLGGREVENHTVAVNVRGAGEASNGRIRCRSTCSIAAASAREGDFAR